MSSKGRSISQQAFDSLVMENMEDLGMDPDEALQDAIQTLTLQGVDLSGIIKCIPGVNGVKDNPIVQSLDRLRVISNALDETINHEEMTELLNKVYDLCSMEASENASIAARNGGVELLISICSSARSEKPLVSALKALSFAIHDVQSTETFRQNGGAKVVVDILNGSHQNSDVLDGGFSVIAAAATGNEVLKESFMDMKIDELILRIMRENAKDTPESLYDAIRVLLTPDDNRVVASQVFGYARRFAKLGIANAIVDALKGAQPSSSSLVWACIALKAVAVNDEICRSISENGGIDAIFQFVDGSGEYNNKAVARACCSLLSKLAGSDDNKAAIVQKGGLDRLIKLSSRFSDDPSVLQEVMSIIGVLSLRSPENAARAVEAGAGDLAIQSMQKFPAAYQMQRQSCLMIRNLVARNPENRTILLSSGIEQIIRKAKASHQSCKDAATDALRDLGLDDYNA